MATYTELFNLHGNSDLRNKVQVACVIAATAIKDETPSVADRIAWANEVLNSPARAAEKVLHAVLAQAKDLTAAQITSAADAGIQTYVNGVVDLLAGAPAA